MGGIGFIAVVPQVAMSTVRIFLGEVQHHGTRTTASGIAQNARPISAITTRESSWGRGRRPLPAWTMSSQREELSTDQFMC